MASNISLELFNAFFDHIFSLRFREGESLTSTRRDSRFRFGTSSSRFLLWAILASLREISLADVFRFLVRLNLGVSRSVELRLRILRRVSHEAELPVYIISNASRWCTLFFALNWERLTILPPYRKRRATRTLHNVHNCSKVDGKGDNSTMIIFDNG